MRWLEFFGASAFISTSVIIAIATAIAIAIIIVSILILILFVGSVGILNLRSALIAFIGFDLGREAG